MGKDFSGKCSFVLVRWKFAGNGTVQTQVWIAVLVYVLVEEFKHRHQLPQPLNDILQILSVTIMQKTPINELFSSQGMRKSTTHDRNQLLLLDL